MTSGQDDSVFPIAIENYKGRNLVMRLWDNKDMAKENDTVNKYIKKMTQLTDGNHFVNMSAENLERKIAHAEYHIASIVEKDPNNPNIEMLRDVLLVMQLARGRGRVM